MPQLRVNEPILGLNKGSVGMLYTPFRGSTAPFLGKFWFVERNQGRIPPISKSGWI
jgi:hypothetical protein